MSMQIRWLLKWDGDSVKRILQTRRQSLHLPYGFGPSYEPLRYEWDEWTDVPVVDDDV